MRKHIFTMTIESIIQQKVAEVVKQLFNENIAPTDVNVQETSKDFAGDLTVVVFPYVRMAKKSPEQTGAMLGEYLKENLSEIKDFNVIKGFLNLEIADTYWINFFNSVKNNENYGKGDAGKKIVLEYCGPNTNKPLHLGHIRNMLIGYATAGLLDYAGHEVHKVNIYNDRGIAICKSMLAWQKFGEGKTPQSEGIKGDHFVGKFYVKFDQKHKEDVENIIEKLSSKSSFWNSLDIDQKEIEFKNSFEESYLKLTNEKCSATLKASFSNIFQSICQNSGPFFHENLDLNYVIGEVKNKKYSSILQDAQVMLVYWESGFKKYHYQYKDEKVDYTFLLKTDEIDQELFFYILWRVMNNWVYEGFEQTFAELGVDFEKHYKESEYFERGKELALEGLEKEKKLALEGLENGFFYQKDDKSVWVNLESDGLDHKLLLRGDGTSVYITQDMGVAEARYLDYQFDQSIYVVANEQDYHFKVLQLVLQKLQKPYADGIYHLSYGMVDLPEGRMKSREGTVVDADDLIQEMVETAEQHTRELGKIDDLNTEQAQELFKTLAMGALKYFILKVNPRKRVIFNPKESIDFQGNTGPFIQYAHARIQSILKKQTLSESKIEGVTPTESEKELLKVLHRFPEVIALGAQNYDISEVANYAFELAKTYNKFYATEPILSAAETEKQFRLQLSAFTAQVIRTCLKLMGINAPDKM